uniref:Uncharacterized protein n=1 Tax=Ditylenchus dipsaci TaxID=166011 RepID=A0A915DKK9_9BILA
MSQQASEATESDSNYTSGEYIEVVHTPVLSPADEKSSSKKDANNEVTSSKGSNEPLLNKVTVDEHSEALPSISFGTSEDRWSSGILGLLAHLSQVLGHGNLIHFPYLCAKHGGAAFFIPYILAYICVGIPVLYAEMLLGQFSSSPSTQIFRQLRIAVAMFAVVLYRSLFFSALIAQLFYAGAISIKGLWSEVPGAVCDPDSQTSLCRDFGYQRFCRAFQHYPGKNTPVCSHNSTLELLDSVSSIKALVPPHTDYMFSAVFKPEIDPMKMKFAPLSWCKRS